jgi:POT family proton-dependent oligopeptide transporter
MSSTSKHPKGLFFLAFTEFWERFGYYLMIGIFFLYMTDTKTGGFGWENAKASDVFGTFIACVYLTPFIGGLLADMKLGYRFAVTLGGILMGIGYCLLSIHEEWAFYTALLIMIVGNGFFKPNISTLLGNLYNDPQYKANKDTGYNLFYMSINIGAFVCNFVAAYMRIKYGWNWAFIAAGVGMFLGVITFWMGMKHYKHVDVRKEPTPEDKPIIMRFLKVLAVALGFGLAGWFIPDTIFGSDSTDAFLCACIPVVYFYASIYKSCSDEEKKPVGTMYTIFGIVIIFWAIFKLNGTALTTYANSYTDRAMPTALVPLADSLFLCDKSVVAENDTVFQLDEHFRRIKDASGNPTKCVDYPSYFKNLAPEKYPAPGKNLTLVPTELFQSINPFFVIILTPLVVIFFGFLRKRKMEPTTATKIAYGLLISGLSTLVMVAAVHYTDNGISKASAWWLIGSYGVITIGELCLSPMGLSMVSKLSPVRFTALMMGGWSLATSIGNKMSGVLAKNWDKFDDKANFFWLNFALLLFAFILMMFLLKRLNKAFKEA